MTEDKRTIQELAKEALQVQDACNLSGVVHGWSRSMRRLCDLVSGGTQDRNTNPINVLWADKVAHLTGTQSLGHTAVLAAYDVVNALAKGEG